MQSQTRAMTSDISAAAQACGVPDAQALRRALHEAHARFRDVTEGAPAQYIPELAKVPPDLFGLAIVTAQGEVHAVGDADYTFTIQSVSKPFTAALVMQQHGSAEVIVEKIGVEPIGQAFNSILATQILPQISVNPLVNSGAIAAVSLVEGTSAEERFDAIHRFYEKLAGEKLGVLEEVYRSELATNQRNRAHGYILLDHDRIYSDPMAAVDVYTRQCSIGVTATQLAMMGATLAHGGVNPITGLRVLDARFVPRVLALMMMSGFYNESGLWAYTAGLPAKTGVGGAIVAIVPGQMALVGFSPRVNDAGNSVRAMGAIAHMVDCLGLSLFGCSH